MGFLMSEDEIDKAHKHLLEKDVHSLTSAKTMIKDMLVDMSYDVHVSEYEDGNLNVTTDRARRDDRVYTKVKYMERAISLTSNVFMNSAKCVNTDRYTGIRFQMRDRELARAVKDIEEVAKESIESFYKKPARIRPFIYGSENSYSITFFLNMYGAEKSDNPEIKIVKVYDLRTGEKVRPISRYADLVEAMAEQDMKINISIKIAGFSTKEIQENDIEEVQSSLKAELLSIQIIS